MGGSLDGDDRMGNTEDSLDGNWVSECTHRWLVANGNWKAYQTVDSLGDRVSDTRDGN